MISKFGVRSPFWPRHLARWPNFLHKECEMRKQHISRITIPPLTAHEKKMWKEYAQARQAKSPQAALKAWARKHNVKLKGKNRVEMVHPYRGTNAPPPATNAAAAAQSCDMCGIKRFERYWKTGKMRMSMTCNFDGCSYEKTLKAWVCWYRCTIGIRYI
jgi:hypothetical protein